MKDQTFMHFCQTFNNINQSWSFQGLKELADTEILSEAANTELEKNNLEQAQMMYTELLKKFDGVLAPPYPVMGRLEDNADMQ